jgi:hypothetical protein
MSSEPIAGAELLGNAQREISIKAARDVDVLKLTELRFRRLGELTSLAASRPVQCPPAS